MLAASRSTAIVTVVPFSLLLFSGLKEYKPQWRNTGSHDVYDPRHSRVVNILCISISHGIEHKI